MTRKKRVAAKRLHLKGLDADDTGPLPPRTAPYAAKITKGVSLLYYKADTADLSRWGLRTKKGDRVIGSAGDLTYEAARMLAKDLAAEEVRTGIKAEVSPEVSSEAMTFGQAWDAYEAESEASGKTPIAMRTIRAHGRALTAIRDWPVATTPLSKLRAWRTALIGSRNGAGRKRTARSVAKNVAALRAALNAAGVKGDWRGLKSGVIKKAAANATPLLGGERDDYIARAYAADQSFGAFAQVLALTGARPGEISACSVGDFDGTALRIREGKTGARTVHLTKPAQAFLAALTAGRGDREPLAPHGDGGRWRTDSGTDRARYFAAGCGAGLYGLRHGFITEAIYGGVPLTSIASACGTSVAMIEMTYGHQLAKHEASVWARVGQQHQRLAAVGGGK